MEEANKAVSKAESIRRFAILADVVDRGGRAADPQPEAQARRGPARAPGRRRRALRPLRSRACPPARLSRRTSLLSAAQDGSQFGCGFPIRRTKRTPVRQSVSCRETRVCLAVPTGVVAVNHRAPPRTRKVNRSWIAEKSCSLVAAVIAALGTLLVFLYVRGADTRADERYEAVQVLRVVKPIDRGRDGRGRPGRRQDRDELRLPEGPPARRAHRRRSRSRARSPSPPSTRASS